MPKNNRDLVRRNARKQKRDAEPAAEAVRVIIYSSDFEKFSEVTLPAPEGVFGIQVSRPEKEIHI